MRRPTTTLTRGALAGVLGATALALWFLVIDYIQGRPLYTPALLATAVGGLPDVQVTFARVALYTLLHYTAFLAVGIGAAALLRKLETPPSFLLGAVLGFFLFNVVFYASVAVTGIPVVDYLGWPEVLIGNLIAGVVVMATLHLTSPVHAMSWWDALRQHSILREGLIAGALGAATVAAWFFVIDLITARALFTPAALGSALFLGARDIADVQITAFTVLSYTFLHVGAFAVIGIVAAAVIHQAEQTPPLLLGFALLAVTGGTLFVGLVAIMAEWILQALAWWSILLGTAFAAIVMGIYLWRGHPVIQDHVRESRRRPVNLEEPI